MEKRKYEVVHRIRFERRKVLKIGAVVELDGQQAEEFKHAIKLLPEEVQGEATSTHEQAPQEPEVGEGTTSDATTEETPRVTDAAREEAERLGISLDHVRATGTGNTLTKSDVRREAKRIREANEAEPNEAL